MTVLVLIRHGVTKWNKEGRYCGHKDIGLSDEGRAQAVRLGRKLSVVKFDKIYCSGMKRARQTGQIVFRGSYMIAVKGLREIDFGALEGLRHAEILDRYGAAYHKWLKDPYKNNIPGAEPMNCFKNRVKSAFKKIVSSNSSKTIAIVCHGGVIGVFVESILKSGNFWSCVPSAGSITVVQHSARKHRVKKFNDITHLGCAR